MSEPKWTAGEWVAEAGGGRGAWIGNQQGDWSALACGNTNEEADANAALISSAPDLYAALAPLADAEPDTPPPGVSVDDWRAAVHAARSARAKARGET